MIGSEKQIAWAEDIRTVIIPEIEAAIEIIRTMEIPAEFESRRQVAMDRGQAVIAEDSAKFWIDTFSRLASAVRRDQALVRELEDREDLTGSERMNLNIRRESLANLRQEVVGLICQLCEN